MRSRSRCSSPSTTAGRAGSAPASVPRGVRCTDRNRPIHGRRGGRRSERRQAWSSCRNRPRTASRTPMMRSCALSAFTRARRSSRRTFRCAAEAGLDPRFPLRRDPADGNGLRSGNSVRAFTRGAAMSWVSSHSADGARWEDGRRPLMVKISPEAEPGAQTPSAARLGLARIERGVNGADHQRAVPGGRRNALGRASADVAMAKTRDAQLEHQRASIRPVPVLGEMRVAARPRR